MIQRLFALALACGACTSAGCSTASHAGSNNAADAQTFGVGSEVPALTRVDQAGTVVNLHNGEPTVLYFYPRDGTPGCTREACAFRDAWERYRVAGIRVVGVSSDDDDSHRKFAEEHALRFSLIADPAHVWSKAFGVGSFAGLDARMSFLIGRDNKVAYVYKDVDPAIHADDVLKDAGKLGLVQ